jgi:ketosteroid isomerase-like protein/quercetin dioxygenase-like cupin family protein
MKLTLAYAAASALLLLATAALAEPPPATAGPVDGLVSSPDNFKLLLENDRVRVLQYTLPPGALDHWHTHPPRVGYVLSGAKIRVTEADGSHQDFDEKAGDIYWGDFSPLHDTYNLGATPYVALLVEVKGAPSSSPSADEAAIRAQRTAFNAAIARGDLDAIGAALADNAQIVTGAESLVFSGRAGELKLWAEDLAAPSRGIYVRTPDRIVLSPVGPMAMESGHWRGVDSKSAKDWASGDYAAKWRRIGGRWLIESETYMTTACGGSYCPKARSE